MCRQLGFGLRGVSPEHERSRWAYLVHGMTGCGVVVPYLRSVSGVRHEMPQTYLAVVVREP